MANNGNRAARRKGRLAGLLFALYFVSLILGQAGMFAFAAETEDDFQEMEVSSVRTDHVLEDDYAPEALCGKEEHTHIAPCFEGEELTCGIQAHVHKKACYPACGIEAHLHGDDCREDGVLVCRKEEHVHDETYCYADCGREAHVHTTAECLDENGELICGLERHIHDVTCCPEKPADPTICGKTAHIHDNRCRDMEGELICGKDEHTHDESCYPAAATEATEGAAEATEETTDPAEETTDPTEAAEPEEKTLYCGLEEHTHSESCDGADGELVCGKDAHQHDESCCTEPTDPTEPGEEAAEPTEPEATEPAEPEEPEMILICGTKEHTHGEKCFDTEGTIVCGQSEHAHKDSCYIEAEGKILYCGLSDHVHDYTCRDVEGEVDCGQEEHIHSESCFIEPEREKKTYCGLDAHTHGEGCYNEWNTLICTLGEHVHDEGCYVESEVKTLVCGLDEHSHGDGCKDENGEIICGLTEHSHEDGCYSVREVYCGQNAHTHDESCLSQAGNRVCGMDEHTHRENCFVEIPEGLTLVCGLDAHVHEDGCRNEDGEIICGLREHSHSDLCFLEIPEGETLVCGLDAHVHEEACQGDDGENICGLVEHIHSEACLLAVPEGMALACGLDFHVHEDGCRDEEGSLTCGLEEHTHAEGCLLPILEGEVYYSVEDPDGLDPDTAYLIMGSDEEMNFLLAADLEALPVAVLEGVDAEGVRCVKLDFGTAPMMAALALDPSEEENGEATEADGTTETPKEKLGDELKWVPEEAGILSNLKDAEAQVALTAEEGGLTVTAEEEPISMQVTGLYAAGLARDSSKETCPSGNSDLCDIHIWEQWDDPDDPGDDVTEMNPFGDAHNYNLFVLGDYVNYGVTHGNAAIGGNLIGQATGISYDEGSNNDYSANITQENPVGLYLGGSSEGWSSQYRVSNGTVIVVEGKDVNITKDPRYDKGHFHYIDQAVADQYFADARRELLASNVRLSNVFGALNHQDSSDYIQAEAVHQLAEHEGRIRYLLEEDIANKFASQNVAGLSYESGGDQADLYLTGYSHEYNVFNIPASMLSARGASTPREVYLDVPFGSYTVINVIPDGTSTAAEDFAPVFRYKNSNDVFISQPADKSQNDNYKQVQRTLVNFDQNITKVTIGSGNYFLYASVMGPQVDMVADKNAVSLQGNIVLGSLTGHPWNEDDASHESVNNATIVSPFEASGAASFRKFVKCESEGESHGEDDCEIVDLNHPEDGNLAKSWENFRVDVTLESVDHVGGSPRVFEIKGMTMDGSPNGDILYLAPGNYRVSVETVYKRVTGENGDPILGPNDEEQWVPISEEGGKIGEHYFNGAYFTQDSSLPENLDFIQAGNLILNIAPYIHEDETIINVYGIETGERIAAVKQWVRGDGDQQVQVAPPRGGYADLCLQWVLYKEENGVRTYYDANGNATTDDTPWEVPKPTISRKRVTADTHWYAEWRRMPTKVEMPADSGNWFEVAYFVKEVETVDGYDQVYNPSLIPENNKDNYRWWENEEAQYSPYYQESAHQWVIKNQEVPAIEGALRVRKAWLDYDGNVIQGEGRESQVKLYYREGRMPEESTINRPFTVTIQIGEGEDAVSYSKNVAVGSDLDFKVYFWSNDQISGVLDLENVTGAADLGEGWDAVRRSAYIGNEQTWQQVFENYVTGTVKDVRRDTTIVIQPKADGTVYKTAKDGVYETSAVTPLTENTGTEQYSDALLVWGELKEATDEMVTRNQSNWGSETGEETAEVLLNEDNGYTARWMMLPMEGEAEDGTTVRYSYYPVETEVHTSEGVQTNVIADYTVTYRHGGAPMTEEEYKSALGVASGVVRINNQESPMPELPEAGSGGTAKYTLGGMLLTLAAAGILMYIHGKRRKEDFASS